eukprot:SM000071S21119  [mRNA]  locus=s71:582577:583872:+ [translate_table: standard]
MGMFVGHAGPGTFWLLAGVWHLANTAANHAANRGGGGGGGSGGFRTRAWHPARLPGASRYLELLLIAAAAASEIAMELFILPRRHQPLDDDWSIPASHLNNFEHSFMSGFFLLYAVAALAAEASALLPLPPGALHALAAVAFAQEALLFGFHSADHMGLEGHYHFLLLLAILAGLVAGLFEIAYPHAVLLPVVRSMSMVLQGTWFWQTAFSIFTDGGLAEGCARVRPEGTIHDVVRCGTAMQAMRAKALGILQYNWHLGAILVFTVVVFCIAGKLAARPGASYEPLHDEDAPEVELFGKPLSSQLEAGTVPSGRHRGPAPSHKGDDEPAESGKMELDSNGFQTVSI